MADDTSHHHNFNLIVEHPREAREFFEPHGLIPVPEPGPRRPQPLSEPRPPFRSRCAFHLCRLAGGCIVGLCFPLAASTRTASTEHISSTRIAHHATGRVRRK